MRAAVGTHYGLTRIYGPTGHAIGGDSHESTMGRRMQLADEERSDSVRRDRRLRDRRERADASVWSTGLREHCKSSRRGMRWVFVILTSRSFFLVGESDPCGSGTSLFELSSDTLSSNDTSQKDVTGLNQSNQ